jgi:hypothetical protein
VNGQPFYVKGAGLGDGSQEALAASGGNSFRTWDTDGGRRMLDRARKNHLFVSLGLVVGKERQGFDYDDGRAVARQLAQIESEVRQFKDHPALLAWIVGNELNLDSHNPRVWDAVESITRMIHRVDPNHPVMTAIAGFDPALIGLLKARVPSLDLLGIQLYAGIDQIPGKLRASGWTGPYLVTEWGPTGHWESARTAWGAPMEEDSSTKAGRLRERYQRYIETDTRQCLGSYVFLWGDKQERTPTWYGLFLASGEATPGVDAMQFVWTGSWPGNRSPTITPIELDGQRAERSVVLRPGGDYRAQVQAEDPDHDPLVYRWQVREESGAKTVGGDREQIPPNVPVRMRGGDDGTLQLRAPARPGTYRLFVTTYDGHGHAAYANFPFQVAAAADH